MRRDEVTHITKDFHSELSTRVKAVEDELAGLRSSMLQWQSFSLGTVRDSTGSRTEGESNGESSTKTQHFIDLLKDPRTSTALKKKDVKIKQETRRKEHEKNKRAKKRKIMEEQEEESNEELGKSDVD